VLFQQFYCHNDQNTCTSALMARKIMTDNNDSVDLAFAYLYVRGMVAHDSVCRKGGYFCLAGDNTVAGVALATARQPPACGLTRALKK
jgi:hypothetical protein